jgi:hypothetical protein
MRFRTPRVLECLNFVHPKKHKTEGKRIMRERKEKSMRLFSVSLTSKEYESSSLCVCGFIVLLKFFSHIIKLLLKNSKIMNFHNFGFMSDHELAMKRVLMSSLLLIDIWRTSPLNVSIYNRMGVLHCRDFYFVIYFVTFCGVPNFYFHSSMKWNAHSLAHHHIQFNWS